MKQPQFWHYKSIYSMLLLPFSIVYLLVSCLRNLFILPYKPPVPVICIGNVTIGGAGKTPTAIAVAKILQDMGKKVVFLSRGYGGKLAGPLVVDSSIHSALDVGDEPLLLSRYATAIIAKNRKEGAKLACEIGSDVIVMDDGLQNPSIYKVLSFLVIDGNYGIGNGRVLPSGPLREILASALSKSDAVIFIGEDKNNVIPKLNGVNIIKARIVAADNKAEDKKYVAFAGIANPDKFFKTLHFYNYNTVKEIGFSDHYNYSKSDIEKLKSTAKTLNAELITTEKDFVRLAKDVQNYVSILPVKIVWDEISVIKNIFKL